MLRENLRRAELTAENQVTPFVWGEKWFKVSINTDWWVLVHGLAGSQEPGRNMGERLGTRWSGEEACG